MIELFRKNLFINSLLLLGYAVVLRIDTLLKPEISPFIEGESYLSHVLKTIFSSPLSQSIFSIGLVYFGALFINRLVIKNKITREITLIPGMIFILLSSLIPVNGGLSNALVSSIFIIASVFHLYSTFNNNAASHHIFLSGFYAGFAGIFYFPMVYFIAVVYIGFLIMRSFILKEKIQLFLGWIISLLLLLVWQYWIEDKNLIVPNYFNFNAGIHLDWNFTSITNYIVLGSLVFISLLFFINKSSFTSKKATSVQRKIDILYWLFAFVGLSIFLFERTLLDHLFVFAVPASILFAMLLIRMKNSLLAEVIHLILLLIVFIIRFELIKF